MTAPDVPAPATEGAAISHAVPSGDAVVDLRLLGGEVSVPSTIIVGTDGSVEAQWAIAAAADIAGSCQADVHVVAAWDPVRVSAADVPRAGVLTEFVGGSEAAAARAMRAAVAALEGAGARAEGHLNGEAPAPLIRRIADSVDADLIILGRRDRGALERWHTGSVSTDLVRHAHRSVLVVRPAGAAWPPRRLVIGDDGSPSAGTAVRMAAGLAMVLELPLHLVRVNECLAVDGRDAAARAERDLAERARRLLRATGLPVTTEVVEGPAPQALWAVGAGSSARPNLLVVGRRGLGPLRSAVLGSVSMELLHRTNCLLLIAAEPRRPGTR